MTRYIETPTDSATQVLAKWQSTLVDNNLVIWRMYTQGWSTYGGFQRGHFLQEASKILLLIFFHQTEVNSPILKFSHHFFFTCYLVLELVMAYLLTREVGGFREDGFFHSSAYGHPDQHGVV